MACRTIMMNISPTVLDPRLHAGDEEAIDAIHAFIPRQSAVSNYDYTDYSLPSGSTFNEQLLARH